ncbi:MAG: carbohydrate kinase [Saprospiraceae bacterium]|nr:MAG: carbohydrate kinase [Saprospiraceae bacterium]
MSASIDIFQRFGQQNILVVGDVMIDRYLTGRVSRISPEAPVPVVEFQESQNRLGGAANVALNLRALGAKTFLGSVIGQDENTVIFQELLEELGLSATGILTSSERMTTVKTRVIASNQHLLRVDREDTKDLSAQESNNFLSQIKGLLDTEKIDLILFQDYNKGVLTEQVIRGIINEALKRNIPTAVDPKFKNFWAYQKVTLFKPNLKEIRSQLPFPVSPTLDDMKKAANFIKDKLNNTATVITLSEKGLFVMDGQSSVIIPTQERSIADVCGAGDTVISVLALGLAAGYNNLYEIATLANLAGGQVCEKVGVVPVDCKQLQKEYVELLNQKLLSS